MVGVTSVDTNERSTERSEVRRQAIVLPVDSRLLTSSKSGTCNRGGDLHSQVNCVNSTIRNLRTNTHEDVGERGARESERNDSLAKHCLFTMTNECCSRECGVLVKAKVYAE